MFRKGDTVVHPEHGAAVIEELREKEFLGEKRTYLVLRVAYGDLTLMIPTDSTEQVGLRSVVSKNLSIRDREKGLSAGEKRMITKARQILISELSHATGKSEEEAEIMIDEVLDDAHGAKLVAEA